MYFLELLKEREKKVKQTLQKIKPVIYLTQQQKIKYRAQIIVVLQNIEKKVASLHEKKDNKKRQANLQFFKEHQAKLTMFAEWLNCPSKKFPADLVKQLCKFIKDLTISHDDKVFEEQLNKIYNKLISSGNQPVQLSHNAFLSSYKNRPKLNDFMLTKQTKQTLSRNSIIPQYKMIDLSVIRKMNIELLFFMFYYHKGETEQLLAAKELMNQSWGFYKKNNLWLKRNQYPTFQGNEFQTGRYLSINNELYNKQKKNVKIYYNLLIREL